MKGRILKNSNEIREELLKMKIIRIAVAYIGKDFKNYIGKLTYNNLQEIVISPTLGSNPDAIRELLDFEEKMLEYNKPFKVGFLDNLHSKIYIGNDSAIITSANLTAHALLGNDNSLIEIGVLIDELEDIEILNNIFSEYLQKSETVSEEKEKLFIELKNKYLNAKKEKIIFENEETNINEDFEIALVYRVDKIRHKSKTSVELREELKNCPDIIKEGNTNYAAYIKEEFTVNYDEILKYNNKWVLIMNLSRRKIVINSNFNFQFVHDILPNCIENEDIYSNAAIQWHLKNTPKKPFIINKNYRKSIENLLRESKYRKYWDEIDINELKKDILNIIK